MEDKRFIAIPYKILGDSRLSQTEKMLYGFINGFAKGKCHAANGFISQTLSVSVSTVEKAIAKLDRLKLIHRSNRYNGGRCVGKVMSIFVDTRGTVSPVENGALAPSLATGNIINIIEDDAAFATRAPSLPSGSVTYEAVKNQSEQQLHDDGYYRKDGKLFNRFDNTEI